MLAWFTGEVLSGLCRTLHGVIWCLCYLTCHVSCEFDSRWMDIADIDLYFRMHGQSINFYLLKAMFSNILSLSNSYIKLFISSKI